MRSGEEKEEEEEEKEMRKTKKVGRGRVADNQGGLDPNKVGAIMGGFVLYCKFRFAMYIFAFAPKKGCVHCTPHLRVCWMERGGFSHHHHGWFCPVIAHRLWLL